jgi:hypothetical protein
MHKLIILGFYRFGKFRITETLLNYFGWKILEKFKINKILK